MTFVIVRLAVLVFVRIDFRNFLKPQCLFEESHSTTAIFLLEVFREVVLLFNPSFDETIPVVISLQSVLVADYPKKVLCPRNCNVHSSIVVEEAETMGSDR